ncbi:hypothetical protein HU200_053851 [Digitaria exilis]|uniref:Uncharacterized protein n=1 Tax=Digitaria exilis TaxID=1010633 RepID=A0A835E4Q7_9POAL|nr:hypothetical protein HU200_053851 [Digitaria exilis]
MMSTIAYFDNKGSHGTDAEETTLLANSYAAMRKPVLQVE